MSIAKISDRDHNFSIVEDDQFEIQLSPIKATNKRASISITDSVKLEYRAPLIHQ